jgi:orotate phosphoribosyltransferase-like protein
MSIDMEYGETLYETSRLKKAVDAYVTTVISLLTRDQNVMGLVSTGSSGSILASALMMQNLPREIYHLHVNKPDGPSHHGKTSGYQALTKYMKHGRYAFIDDFISSGCSLMRCVDECNKLENVQLCYAITAKSTSFRHAGIRNIEVGNRFQIWKESNNSEKSK